MTNKISDINFSECMSCEKLNKIIEKNDLNGHENQKGTDKGTSHSYLPVYESIFDNFLEKKENISVLEIGIQYGGSIFSWHELHEGSYVIGIDINNDNINYGLIEKMQKDRYSIIIDNAYSDNIVAQIKSKFPNGIDFIVDDGPHSIDSQIKFIEMYLPLLTGDGILVIEDIASSSYLQILENKVLEDNPNMSCIIQKVDRRHIKGRCDDLMLIIQKI
jgi:cephalosporin hydroxylase